jgi:hypothetical protein
MWMLSIVQDCNRAEFLKAGYWAGGMVHAQSTLHLGKKERL